MYLRDDGSVPGFGGIQIQWGIDQLLAWGYLDPNPDNAEEFILSDKGADA